ncbi:MAG: putative membrane protein [Paraglaciecola sp.]|jgi:putative membrane protein
MKFKGLLSLVVVLVLLLIGGFVGSQNTHSVMVNYLVAQGELRVSVLMLVMLLVGVAISAMLFTSYILRLKWRIHSLQRQHKKLIPVEKA